MDRTTIASQNYRLLFISMIISTFSSFMFFAAIQIEIFTDKSAYNLFLSILSYTIPSVFIVPFIIKYTYRVSKKKILLLCSFLRLFFSIYLFFYHNFYEIYFSIFILSLVSSVAFIAQKTMLRALSDDHKTLAIRNSWLSSVEMFAEIFGGVIGSLAIFFINFEGVIIFLCICLLLSTLLIFQIDEITSDAFEAPLVEAYADVYKIIINDRKLLIQIVFFCVTMALSTILYGFLIAFVSSNFHNIPYAYSFFLLVAGLGAVVGAKVMSIFLRLGKKNNLNFVYKLSFCLGSLIYTVFSYVQIIFLGLVVWFLYTMIFSILKNAHQGFIYSKFPLNLQEPAWGILNIFWHLTILISALCGGILIDMHGINWVLQNGAFISLASILLFGCVLLFNKKVSTREALFDSDAT